MKSIKTTKKTFCVFLLILFSSLGIAGTLDYNFPPFEFDPDSLPAPQPIKAECRHLTMDPNNKRDIRLEIPNEAFKNRDVGYAVYDFQIDNQGNPTNIELISQKSKKYFVRNSTKKLKLLKFTIDPEWISNCSEQKYRIGYAFRIMSKCTYKEFPAPIINICAMGMAEKITN